MGGKKLHIKSFGCQMNKLDSALVTAALEAGGFELTDKAVDADVVLMNTCSVREHAEQRVLSHLGHLTHAKKSRPGLIVAVTGCMAQRLGQELLEYPAVDIVAGPSQLPLIPEMIEQALVDRRKLMAVTTEIRQKPDVAVNHRLDDFEATYDSDEHTIPGQAFVRVMRGCNNFCTYCIVPYVRGPEVSRPLDDIVEQVLELADRGTRQITLLGQTINSYCDRSGSKEHRLPDLLTAVSEIDGIEWIRFITSHPAKFDRSIMQAMADLPKVCPYLHLPAQSGSDRILKAMNRGYTADQYLELLDEVRQFLPDIAIAGDFIVGFPGETDSDFEDTVTLVQKARYKNCFVFKYSPRPGTRADNSLADDIPQEVKKQRNIKLLEVQNQISEQDNRSLQGRTVTVLVEGLSKKPHLNSADNLDNPQLIARTATDHIVVFNGPQNLTGHFAEVTIERTAALTLFGQHSGSKGCKK